jgi:hypothetical protein
VSTLLSGSDGGGQLWVKGGCRRQVDGRAGLPSAPEMPCVPSQLRLVPFPDLAGDARPALFRRRQPPLRLFVLTPQLLSVQPDHHPRRASGKC